MAIGNSVKETERYLDVIERFNPEINAVLTKTPEMALEMAHEADKAADEGEWLGLLHGVPMRWPRKIGQVVKVYSTV